MPTNSPVISLYALPTLSVSQLKRVVNMAAMTYPFIVKGLTYPQGRKLCLLIPALFCQVLKLLTQDLPKKPMVAANPT